MSTLNKLILFCLGALLLSCTNPSKTESAQKVAKDTDSLPVAYHIKIPNTLLGYENDQNPFVIEKLQSLSFSNWFEEEHQRDTLMAGVSFVDQVGGNIYVSDGRTASLKMFDAEGRYIRDFVNLGKGPGEMTKIGSVVVDENKKAVYVHSFMEVKTMKFSLTGELLKEYILPFFGFNMIPYQDGFAFHINYNTNDISQNNNVLVTDAEMNIRDRLFLFDEADDGPIYSFTGGVKVNEQGFLYFSAFNDTIFEVADNSIRPKYIFSFPTRNEPLNLNDINSGKVSYINIDYMRFQSPALLEGRDVTFFCYVVDQVIHPSIWIKEKNELLSYEQFGFMRFFYMVFRPVSKLNDEVFISSFSPQELADWMEIDESLRPYLEKHYPELLELDLKNLYNPILVYFRVNTDYFQQAP